MRSLRDYVADEEGGYSIRFEAASSGSFNAKNLATTTD
jgi:hypothetical protein